MKIESINIRGFRGVRKLLAIPLENGGGFTGCTIYGRNGTGKSSIVDAWEWLQTGTVDHLSREGAGKDTYPNRYMAEDEAETWIEVQLRDPDQKLRLSFDGKSDEGDIDAFRETVLRPCQIRFTDLKTFVLTTKSKKFQALAEIMGLEEQATYQKALERARRSLSKAVEESRTTQERAEQRFAAELGADIEDAVPLIRGLLDRAGGEPADLRTLDDLRVVVDALDFDTTARRMANLEAQRTRLQDAEAVDESKLSGFFGEVSRFSALQSDLVDGLLVRLYETGEDLLADQEPGGQTVCPLCDQEAPHLHEHVEQQLAELSDLRQARTDLEARRRDLQTETAAWPKILKNCQWNDSVAELVQKLTDELGAVLELLEVPVEELVRKGLPDLKRLEELAEDFHRARRTEIDRLTEILAGDAEEARNARDQLLRLRDALRNLEEQRRIADTQSDRLGELDAVVEHYRARNVESLREAFGRISKLVSRYFAILEQSNPAFADARLEIDENGSAAYLSVEVFGEREKPAFRTLSESQLNSFGLAVQLAVSRVYNPDFKFLVLDDVINSFDAYKRPRVIQLLRQEFQDFQILLLTHDDIWRERLYRGFPSWNRRELVNHATTQGARFRPRGDATDQPEAVRRALENDRPHNAGALFGPYLEGQLQLLCESCEAELKYSRHRPPSLSDLLIACRKRAKKKLGGEHPLVEKLRAFEEQSFFRNWMAHEKNPTSSFSPDEIGAALALWMSIETLAQCEDCGEYAAYDGKGFTCPCGEHQLTKEGANRQ